MLASIIIHLVSEFARSYFDVGRRDDVAVLVVCVFVNAHLILPVDALCRHGALASSRNGKSTTVSQKYGKGAKCKLTALEAHLHFSVSLGVKLRCLHKLMNYETHFIFGALYFLSGYQRFVRFL